MNSILKYLFASLATKNLGIWPKIFNKISMGIRKRNICKEILGQIPKFFYAHKANKYFKYQI